MSNTSLMATIGLDVRDFRTGLTASKESLKELDAAVKGAAAQIASFETAMKGGGTSEQIKQLAMMRDHHRELQAELKNTTRQMAAFQAASELPTKTSDADRYQSRLQSMAEEQEQERRARTSSTGDDGPTPAQARFAAYQQKKAALEARMQSMVPDQGAIRRAEEAAGVAAVGGSAGIGRMGKMELGHVARSLAGSAAAGVPLVDGLMMETPRILQALGPALGSLLPVIGPLAVAFTGLKLAVSAHKANNEARSTRREIDHVAGQSASSSEQLDELFQETEREAIKVREKRKKRGFFNKMFGAGISQDYEREAQERSERVAVAAGAADRKDADFDQRKFDGDPMAELDDLTRARDAKVASIRKKFPKDDSASAQRRVDAITKAHADYDLEVKKLGRRRAEEGADLDVQRDTNTAREQGKNMAVEGPAIALRRATARLEHGPQMGSEHDANAAAAHTAAINAGDAQRAEKTRAAGVAAEQQIVQIKREGFDVDRRIAQQRLEAAQAALANSREKEGAEYDALKLAVSSAQAEVQAAEKITGERKAQAAIEEQGAKLRGSSAQVRRATLGLEHVDLVRQAAENVQDPARSAEINAQLARNQQQRDELEKAEKLRAIDTASVADHAQTGRGTAAQLGFLEREIGRVTQRQDWNKNENGNDAGMGSQLDDTLRSLKQAIEDLTFAERSRLTALNQENKRINRRGFDASDYADSDTDDKYDREKVEAEHRGASPEELAGIERNRADEHDANAADELQRTPEQKLERTRRDDARARAYGTVASTKARHEEAAAANGGDAKKFFDAARMRRDGSPASPLALGGTAALIGAMSAADIRQGAERAGKHDDSGKVDNQGIIAAINQPEWVKTFSVKNRA